MVDIFTYVVYTVFLATSFFLAVPTTTDNRKAFFPNNKHTYRIYFFVVFYTFFVGLRYKVGTDYEIYLNWFKYLKATGSLNRFGSTDFGYILLNKLLIFIDAHFSVLFVIIAFLQIFFLTLSLKRTPFLFGWYIFFFFTSLLMFSSMNHMRQTIAYFVFFYSIYLYFERKYLLQIIVLILAFSIHKSIIMYLWVYPILRFDWFKNNKLQYIIIISSAFVGEKVFDFVFNLVSSYAHILNYGVYIDQADKLAERTIEFNSGGAGFGKYLFLAVDLVIIYYSPALKSIFRKFSFTAFYNIYFLGAIIENVVASNYIFARAADYFVNFRVLILSFLCYYLYKSQTTKNMKLAILLVLVLVFLAYFYRGIYKNTASVTPFEFVFI